MANIELSAVASTSFAATASLTVNRPRIKKISISGYRAFPPYRPESFEVNLGNDGKNLLLYGENGSGKTSLFKALRELFSESPNRLDYEDRKNIFKQENDDSVVVQLTSGMPSEYRWETGEQHPKETEGVPFRTFARSCLFLDYRDLLKTNFTHPAGYPNLFFLLVQHILRDLPVPDITLHQLYVAMHSANPTRRTHKLMSRAQFSASRFGQALKDSLPEIVKIGNEFLAKLQPSATFDLVPMELKYAAPLKTFVGQTVSLTASYNGKGISEPQNFLNEAKLTALALAIYLAGAKVIRAGRPGILVLDDVLMGLDLENRIPLLRLLDEDFSDWQTILLTHDRTWFELAREFTDNKPMWKAKELFLVQGTDGSPPIPEIRDGCDPISRATAMIARGEYNPAANYLRISFENTIKRACDHCKIEVAYKRNPKKITANDLWMGLCRRQKDREALQAKHPAKNHPDFIPQNLISRVNMIRSNILNGLSHDGSTNIQKAEVEAARDTIRDLSMHPFPPSND
jgi:energy-coupling factor transporter ATP-binding protein EcfA2